MTVFFVLLAAALNSSHADPIIDDIAITLSKYDACTGESYSQQDLDSFKQMFEELKSQNTKPTLEVTDYSVDGITITDFKHKKECTLTVDVYDGRCMYAYCY